MRALFLLNLGCAFLLIGITLGMMLLPYSLPDSFAMIPADTPPRAWLLQTVRTREAYVNQRGIVASQPAIHAWTLAKFGVEGCYREARAPFVITCIHGGVPRNLPFLHYGALGILLSGAGFLLSGMGWQWATLRHHRRYAPQGYRPPRWSVWPLKHAHLLHGLLPYWPLLSRRQRALLVAQGLVPIAVAASFYVYNLLMLQAAG